MRRLRLYKFRMRAIAVHGVVSVPVRVGGNSGAYANLICNCPTKPGGGSAE